MQETLERVGTNIELTLLEGWDSEVKCESQHMHSKGQCTVTAEYVVVHSCDKESVLWCVARYREHTINKQDRRCLKCKRSLEDCWNVRPL